MTKCFNLQISLYDLTSPRYVKREDGAMDKTTQALASSTHLQYDVVFIRNQRTSLGCDCIGEVRY